MIILLCMLAVAILWGAFLIGIFPFLDFLNQSQWAARQHHRLRVFLCLYIRGGHKWHETYEPGEHYRWCSRCLEYEDLYLKRPVGKHQLK